MRFKDLFALSIRMFKTKTSRTLLTVLGMSIGISAVFFLVSLGYGLQNTVLQKITTSDSLLSLDVAEDRSSPAILDRLSVEKIGNISGVSETSPASNLKAKGKFKELAAELSVLSVKPVYFRLSGIKAEKGSVINDENVQEIAVSSALAKVFGVSPDELIGEKMTFSFDMGSKSEETSGGKAEKITKVDLDKEFKITGVIQGEENMAYINSGALESLGVDHFDELKVKCASNDDLGRVKEEIGDLGFSVSSLSEMVDQVNEIFDIIKIALLFFGFIALVVSAIGMFNTMTVALLERTEEIGIMKSIGASDMNIILIFILEATVMGFLGGVAGGFFGW